MKNLFATKFPLLVLTLLFALANSGIAYALTPNELPTTGLSTFHRSFGLWVVTTESEFNDGVLNNVDTSSSPGDVKLGTTSFTTTYDYSFGVGTDKWAYESPRAGGQPPLPAGDPAIQNEILFTSYTEINSSDDTRYATPAQGNKFQAHHFIFSISEDPAVITSLYVEWEGYAEAAPAILYIWNFSTTGWEEVGNHSLTAADAAINYTYSTATDYIDASGLLHLAATGAKATNSNLFTDYVKADITYTGYYSVGTIASNVYDAGVVDARWELLGWADTLPSGTDITFEVRASDAIFLKDDATPAWQDASAIPIAGRYQQWRATLTTTDGDETPVLHEVWVLYSW